MADERMRQYEEQEIRRHMPTIRPRSTPVPCDEYTAKEIRVESKDLTPGEIAKMKATRRNELQARRQADVKLKAELKTLRTKLQEYGPKSMRRLIRRYGESSIEPLRILFTGPNGAGVTSVIHLIERALRDVEGPTDARAGVPTQYFTEHFTDLNYIRAFDCPPMEYANTSTIMNTLISVLNGNVLAGEKLDPDKHGVEEEDDSYPTTLRAFHDLFKKCLAVVFVLPFDMLIDSEKRRMLSDRYADIWPYLHRKGYTTGCIVTGGDQLDEEHPRARLEGFAKRVLNAPDNDDFVIVLENYETYSPIKALQGVRYPQKANYVEEIRALKFLWTMVGSCEVKLEDRIAEAKNKAEDAPHSSDSREGIHPDTHIRTFLAQQNKWNQWRKADLIFQIAEMFAEHDVFNFAGLRACYDDMSDLLAEGSSIPLKIRNALKEAVEGMSKSGASSAYKEM
eukprot:scpid60463/ scgid25453/ 